MFPENGFSFQSQHVGSNHIETQEPQRVWGDSQVKPGAEAVGRRRNRLGRSTALRKSLAWDKAFFTDEGMIYLSWLYSEPKAKNCKIFFNLQTRWMQGE
jgi:hypothetical protein